MERVFKKNILGPHVWHNDKVK